MEQITKQEQEKNARAFADIVYNILRPDNDWEQEGNMCAAIELTRIATMLLEQAHGCVALRPHGEQN